MVWARTRGALHVAGARVGVFVSPEICRWQRRKKKKSEDGKGRKKGFKVQYSIHGANIYRHVSSAGAKKTASSGSGTRMRQWLRISPDFHSDDFSLLVFPPHLHACLPACLPVCLTQGTGLAPSRLPGAQTVAVEECFSSSFSLSIFDSTSRTYRKTTGQFCWYDKEEQGMNHDARV